MWSTTVAPSGRCPGQRRPSCTHGPPPSRQTARRSTTASRTSVTRSCPRSRRWTGVSACRCSWTASPVAASPRPPGSRTPRCEDSAERVRPLRAGAEQALGSSTSDVEVWEVAVVHRDHATGDGACARVTWLSGDPTDAERAIDVYKMAVLPRIQELDGFCSASLLVNREAGHVVGTVTFESRAQLESSRDARCPHPGGRPHGHAPDGRRGRGDGHGVRAPARARAGVIHADGTPGRAGRPVLGSLRLAGRPVLGRLRHRPGVPC